MQKEGIDGPLLRGMNTRALYARVFGAAGPSAPYTRRSAGQRMAASARTLLDGVTAALQAGGPCLAERLLLLL